MSAGMVIPVLLVGWLALWVTATSEPEPETVELPQPETTAFQTHAYTIQVVTKRSIRDSAFRTRAGGLQNLCIVEGVLRQDGEEFTLPPSGPCIKYRCRNGTVELGTLECLDGASCVPLGYVRKSRCLEHTCTREGNTLRFKPTKEGCDVNGRCHPLDMEVEEECVTFRCKKTGGNGSYYYSAERLGIKCKDADGVCRVSGSVFPFVVGGVRHQYCTCSVQGTSITTQCLSL